MLSKKDSSGDIFVFDKNNLFLERKKLLSRLTERFSILVGVQILGTIRFSVFSIHPKIFFFFFEKKCFWGNCFRNIFFSKFQKLFRPRKNGEFFIRLVLGKHRKIHLCFSRIVYPYYIFLFILFLDRKIELWEIPKQIHTKKYRRKITNNSFLIDLILSSQKKKIINNLKIICCGLLIYVKLDYQIHICIWNIFVVIVFLKNKT
jgi:hypothetical protein